MKGICCVLLLFSVLTGAGFGGELGETAELTEIYSVEEFLGQQEREISGELQIDGSYDARGALGRLWEKLRTGVTEQFRQELRFALEMVAVALLGSLAAALSPNQKIPAIMELAACGGISLLLSGSLEGVISQATDTLNRLADYSRAAMPAFFTAVAASGAATTAPVKYAAFSLMMDVFMTLTRRWILPLIYTFLAVSVSSSLFPNAMLTAVGRFTKWCAVTAMTAVTTVFGIYVSLSGVISGSTDAMAVKTARTVVSSALPVVGGILSDSAAVMLSAAGLIKNTAGVFSLIAICAFCAGPFAVLGVKMLLFKAASAAAELCWGGRYSRLLGDFGTAFGMLLGLVGSFAVMLFLSIMSGIRVVSA